MVTIGQNTVGRAPTRAEFKNTAGTAGVQNNIIDQYIMKEAFFMMRKRYPLMAFLASLQQKSTVRNGVGKEILWNIGDAAPTRIIWTTGSVTVPFNATTITLPTGYDYLTAGTMLNITDTANTASAAITGYRTPVLLLRITARLGSTNYSCEVVKTNMSTNGITVTAATARVNILSHLNEWSGLATEGTNRRPDIMSNILQRCRETVIWDKVASAEQFYTDVKIMRQIQLKLNEVMEKMNKSLILNHYKSSSVTVNGREAGLAGGLPHFMNYDLAATEITPSLVSAGYSAFAYLKAKTACPTSWTYASINEFSIACMEYGSKDKEKIIHGSPTNILKFKNALVNNTVVHNGTYNVPSQDSIWNMEYVQLAGGKFWFMPDDSLNDVTPWVYSDGDTGVELDAAGNTNLTHPTQFVQIIDPGVLALDYLTIDGVSQKLVTRPVERKEGNPSTEEYEIESFFTLVCTEPRALGMFSKKTS